METLQKTWQQITDLYRSMTPGARITTAALVATVVVSLGFLFRYGGSAPDQYLFGGRVLSDREIARLEAAFSKAGLNDWDAMGNRIRVPKSKRFTYIAAAAAENSLPDNFDTILAEMINRSSPFEPKEMRDMKMRFALQMEVAQVIEAMQGIEKATVKFNEERAAGFQRETKKTALVAAQADGNVQLTHEQIESIRRTVATAFGAPPENVVVTDLRGSAHPGHSADGTPTADQNVYAANKMMWEKHFQQKIQNALAMIPGVIVGVNVELDPRLNQKTQTRTFNQPQTIRSSNSMIKSTTRSDSGGGRVGSVPNCGLGNRAEEVTAAPTGGNESTNSESREENDMIVGHETIDVVQAGLTPTSVTATIQIPSSYFRTIWAQRNRSEPGKAAAEPDKAELLRLENEEISRIQESVQNLIPRLSMGKDPFPRVSVQSFVDTKPPEPAGPALTTQVVVWLAENWRTLALVMLAACGLLMLRSLARSAAEATAGAVPALQLAGEDAGDEETATDDQKEIEVGRSDAGMLKRRFVTTGPSLRDELAELVREDPDTAAAILSSWIGDVH